MNVYSTPVMNVSRNSGWYNNNDAVYGVFTVPDLGGEPEQVHYEWNRSVTLNTMETSYDVPAHGTRNGMYQHLDVEDQLYRIGAAPRPAWDAKFVINSYWVGEIPYWGWPCGDQYWSEGICTDVNAFVSPYSPNGTAIITNIDLPFQTDIGTLFSGREVSVGPH